VGLKQFPRSALLNLRAAALETGKGLFGGYRARQYLHSALKLAEASTDPKETALVVSIKKALTLANEIDKMPIGFPSFRDRRPDMPFGAFTDFFEDWDEDEEDDDDEFEPRPASSRRRAPKTKKPNGPKRR
jgi:hypothetical protein